MDVRPGGNPAAQQGPFALPGHAALGPPTLRRQPEGEGRDDHDDEVDDPQSEKGLRRAGASRARDIDPGGLRHDHVGHVSSANNDHLDRPPGDLRKPPAAFRDQRYRIDAPQVLRRLVEESEQVLLDRRADDRSAAKAHDRQARGHAAPVRKPPDERRHRRDVPDAKAASAQDAVPQIDHPKFVQVDADATHDEPAAPEERREHADKPGPQLIQRPAGNGRRHAQEDDGDGEYPNDGVGAPVVSAACHNAKLLHQGGVEDAPGVHGPHAEVHGNGDKGHLPPVEVRRSDNAVLPQESNGCGSWHVWYILTSLAALDAVTPLAAPVRCGWTTLQTAHDSLTPANAKTEWHCAWPLSPAAIRYTASASAATGWFTRTGTF